MASVLTELSNYIMSFCLAMFLLCNAIILVGFPKKKHNYLYLVQSLLTITIHTVAYCTLYLRSQDIRFFFFFAFQEILLFGFIAVFRILYEKADRMLLNNMVLLQIIGFVILGRLDLKNSVRQFLISIVGLAVFLAVPIILKKIYEYLKRLEWVYFTLGTVLLSGVLLMAEVTHGSKLAFNLGIVSFQPSEFVKISLVFMIAAMIYKAKKITQYVLSLGASMVHVGLLVLSRDLGCAAIYFVVFAFMIYIKSRKEGYFFALAGMGGLAAVLAYYKFSHVRVRVQTWINPFSDISKKGYQLTQSLFAIGSGGWFGMGLLQGAPATIPYVNKDFIFSAIAEEMGSLFAILLLFIYLCCFFIIIRFAVKSGDDFSRMLLSGFGIMMIFQVFLTVGGGTRFIPLTGVTLPLISTGGSSIISTLLIFALIQGVIIMVKEEDAIVLIPEELQESLSEAIEDKPKVLLKERIFNILFHNRPFKAVLTTFSILFILLSVNIAVFLFGDSFEIISNPYNQARASALATLNSRGKIYANDMSILAYSVSDNGQEQRVYPYGTVFSHVVGFCNNGKLGLESMTDMRLLSTDASVIDKIRNQQNHIKNPGNDVYTTLDVCLQKAAYDALGNQKGAVVVMNAKTGEILALVSKPDFDPMTIDENWESIIGDEERACLLNRGTQGLYPPGSIFKMIDVLEYIRENGTDYSSFTYECKGKETFEDETISCYHNTVHGTVDFKSAFAKSCNCAFASMGSQFESKEFSKTLNECLFNQKLPLQLAYSESKISTIDNQDESTVVQNAIGQGTMQMTPMHVAILTAAIANDGKLMTPYLVKSIKNPSGGSIREYNPKLYASIMTLNESKAIKELMESVVTEGTGDVLKDAGYTSAGKTGSAEFGTDKNQSHAWFTGYAPAEDPKIVVTVIVEGGGSGGRVAAPIAKAVWDEYFDINSRE